MTDYQRQWLELYWQDQYFTEPLKATYQYPIYPVEQTVTFTYPIYYNEEEKEYNETFECGPSLWQNVRRWTKNVQVN